MRQCVWGLDLAGQAGAQSSALRGLEGAGGIGGLLAMYDGDTGYRHVYTYDQLGNRLEKLDNTAGLKTCYAYDVQFHYDPQSPYWDTGMCFTPDNPAEGNQTRNNRLVEYRVYQDDGQSGWDELRSVKYTYYQMGHVAGITVKDTYISGMPGSAGDYDWYNNLTFYYTANGKLWRVLWDRWQVDQNDDPDMQTYQKLAAREFFYDGPRQRYLVRDLNSNTWAALTGWQWTDYAGDMPYADFAYEGSGSPAESTLYFGLMAQQDAATDDATYLHGDLVDSKMLTTDEDADAVETTAYTAFGELVTGHSALSTRYGYAGGHGYESDLVILQGANTALAPLMLQHVGWRWYQSDIGRFVQRDPIGVQGGLNLYAYVFSNPLIGIDPMGKSLGDVTLEGILDSPMTQGAGVVIVIIGGGVIVAGAPVAGAAIGIGGTLLWGGLQIYHGAQEFAACVSPWLPPQTFPPYPNAGPAPLPGAWDCRRGVSVPPLPRDDPPPLLRAAYSLRLEHCMNGPLAWIVGDIRVLFGQPPRRIPLALWRHDRRTRRTVRYAVWAIVGLLIVLTFSFAIQPRAVLRAPLVVKLLFVPLCVAFAYAKSRSIKNGKRRFQAYLEQESYDICPSCGYLLKLLPDEHQCPECSTPYRRADVRRHWTAWVREAV